MTAEPAPSRLAAIALGTGDIDCVYHFALPELLDVLADGHRVVVTLEDGQLEGGWGEKVTAFYANSTNPKAATVHALNFGASKEFTDRVPLAELDERYGLTVEAVADRIRRVLAR